MVRWACAAVLALGLQGTAFADAGDTQAVSTCDLAAKARMKSPSSYDPAWEWSIIPQGGGKILISRKFEASNSFGAHIGGTWFCGYNRYTGKVTELTIMQ